MFHQFLPNPTRIDFPAITGGTHHYVELARALDVSNFRWGSLYFRVHNNIGAASQSGFKMQLTGYPIWPDDSTGARLDITALFQNSGITALETADMTNSTTNGELINRITSGGVDPAAVVMPALRILAHFHPDSNITANYIVISAGIALVA